MRKRCFGSVLAARNARLVRCLIKSVAIVNKSVRKPPLNIHTQNSDAQKLRYDTIRDVPPRHPYAHVRPISIGDTSVHFATATKKISERFVNRGTPDSFDQPVTIPRKAHAHKYINHFSSDTRARARTRNQSPLHTLEWLMLLVKHRIRAN